MIDDCTIIMGGQACVRWGWHFRTDMEAMVIMGELELSRGHRSGSCSFDRIFPNEIPFFISLLPLSFFPERPRADYVLLLPTQALQAAVQKIHTYVATLEEKMEAMEKKKKSGST